MAVKTMLLKCKLFNDCISYGMVAEVPSLDHDERVDLFVPVAVTRLGGVVVDVIDTGEKTSLVAVTGESCSSTKFPPVYRVLNEHLEELE